MAVRCRLDHLVVAATTLSHGIDYVVRQLGVEVPTGGQHPDMGTHNHLMRLGDDSFLEIIAINPQETAPSRPRWFGLDDPHIRASLIRSPRLLTWVAATNDLDQTFQNALLPIGRPTWLSRGDLRWQFAVTDDGSLLNSGMLPHIIQWPPDLQVAQQMPDLGCRLKRLTVHHPQAAWYLNQLTALNLTDAIQVFPVSPGKSPWLEARFSTPTGERVLSSCDSDLL